MQGVFEGFGTIGLIIGAGMLLAQFKILDASSQLILSRLAFFVASPALMITVLGGTDVSAIFSANLIASIGSVVVTAVVYVLLAKLIWSRTASDTVIGAFASSYVNAGNLGLPIAAYVLGDASLIAPMLLTQMLILQPVGLTVLDMATRTPTVGESKARRLLRVISQPLRNPLMIGSLLGLLLSVSEVTLPRFLFDPLDLLGGMAVPAMLIAFGVSLRLGPLPGSGEPKVQIGVIVGLKLVLQPTVAFLIGWLVLDLSHHALLAVTVIAALPTAQNIFTHAVRYQRGIILARDSIFVSTLLSVPAVIIIVALIA